MVAVTVFVIIGMAVVQIIADKYGRIPKQEVSDNV